ncbi:MAG TPA: substrate-binding domain-containing protein [Burkholderiaceae bacterium]|nr:substrate-binding domain-containing protein [Burkholderiaceae bacterium]
MTELGVKELHLLSAGAAQGLIEALAPQFLELTGVALRATFGAVGTIREKLLAGEQCDVLLLTEPMIEQLATSGLVVQGTQAALGRVRTGIGVRSGDALPDISSRAALQSSLRAATDIFSPDPERSTAGIHLARVLDQLGIRSEVAPRVRPFPNGAAAMQALAHSRSATPIGCTQVSEIKHAQGVRLVGLLPAEFELATVYSIAVCSAAKQPSVAQRFARWLCGTEARDARVSAGFELE